MPRTVPGTERAAPRTDPPPPRTAPGAGRRLVLFQEQNELSQGQILSALALLQEQDGDNRKGKGVEGVKCSDSRRGQKEQETFLHKGTTGKKPIVRDPNATTNGHGMTFAGDRNGNANGNDQWRAVAMLLLMFDRHKLIQTNRPR